MTTRIYLVQRVGTDQVSLVDAATPAQAIRHVTRGAFVAAVATTKDMHRLRGVDVETAGETPAEPERVVDAEFADATDGRR